MHMDLHSPSQIGNANMVDIQFQHSQDAVRKIPMAGRRGHHGQCGFVEDGTQNRRLLRNRYIGVGDPQVMGYTAEYNIYSIAIIQELV